MLLSPPTAPELRARVIVEADVVEEPQTLADLLEIARRYLALLGRRALGQAEEPRQRATDRLLPRLAGMWIPSILTASARASADGMAQSRHGVVAK